METYLIDSSVWVSLFLNFDSQHNKAEKLITEINGKIYVPYCVAMEVTTILTYKHSKEQANNFLSYIEDNNDIILLDNQIYPEIQFFKTVENKISFADISLIFTAKKMNLTLLTFDKQIIKILNKK